MDAMPRPSTSAPVPLKGESVRDNGLCDAAVQRREASGNVPIGAGPICSRP